MINLRKSSERGSSKFDWLDSRHTFSFSDYYDPQHMHFGSLRVINEDFVQEGKGFATHPHDNMEIISYIVEGAMQHKDSMGNGSVIKPGEVQRMSAGTGVLHSEFNPSANQALHLLQIWILPDSKNLTPSYEQKTINKKINELILIGARKGDKHVVSIHQDVLLYTAFFTANHAFDYHIKPNRKVWIQLINGELQVADELLKPGDAVAIEEEQSVSINALADAEFLLFDLGY